MCMHVVRIYTWHTNELVHKFSPCTSMPTYRMPPSNFRGTDTHVASSNCEKSVEIMTLKNSYAR